MRVSEDAMNNEVKSLSARVTYAGNPATCEALTAPYGVGFLTKEYDFGLHGCRFEPCRVQMKC
jgi:hypothetical protein